MSPQTKQEKLQLLFRPFARRLRIIFDDMDRKYTEAADHYGFFCQGCKDNCCRSLFFHHTFLEYFYLLDGYRCLEAKKQKDVTERAADNIRKMAAADKQGAPVRPMCPINFSGSCILYSYRPMICRLHGIPHELTKPGQETVYGPGCEIFASDFSQKDYFTFDRTPFYFRLAALEKAFKIKAGVSESVKMTIARMIVTLDA
jgi:hypothetical protein